MVKITLEIAGPVEESFVQKIASAVYQAGHLSAEARLEIKVIKVVRRPWGAEGKGPEEFHIVYSLPSEKTERRLCARLAWYHLTVLAEDAQTGGWTSLGEIVLKSDKPEYIAEALIKALAKGLDRELSLLKEQSRRVFDLRNQLLSRIEKPRLQIR